MLKKLKDILEAEGKKVLVVEIGAACPIAHGLMQCEGASKVVYHTESPYGSAKSIYPHSLEDYRMVSAEAVANIAMHHVRRKHSENLDYNTVIVTSFQIRSGGNDNKVPHGWVAIATIKGELSGEIETFHLTMAYPDGEYYNRIESIEKIGLEVTALFDADRSDTVDGGSMLSAMNSRATCLIHEGKLARIEEVSRKYRRIVLYKGSFNPMHLAHEEIARKVMAEDTLVILGISRNTYSKGQVSLVEMVDRCKNISELGYTVAIFEEGYFYDSIEILKKRTGLPVDVAMGVDTFNRLARCYDTGDFSPLERIRIYSETGRLGLALDWSDNRAKVFNAVFGDTIFHVFGRGEPLYTSTLDPKIMFDETYNNPVSSSEIRVLEASGESEKAQTMKAGQ